MCSRKPCTRPRATSGSVPETSDVESTRSTNITVASFRSTASSLRTTEEVVRFRSAERVHVLESGYEVGLRVLRGYEGDRVVAAVDLGDDHPRGGEVEVSDVPALEGDGLGRGGDPC